MEHYTTLPKKLTAFHGSIEEIHSQLGDFIQMFQQLSLEGTSKKYRTLRKALKRLFNRILKIFAIIIIASSILKTTSKEISLGEIQAMEKENFYNQLAEKGINPKEVNILFDLK